MPPTDDKFAPANDRALLEAIVAAHAAQIVASAVRALLDGGAIVPPPGLTPDAIEVTANPSVVTLTVGGHDPKGFRVNPADDALTVLQALLQTQVERAVGHLNEVLEGNQEGHLQW